MTFLIGAASLSLALCATLGLVLARSVPRHESIDRALILVGLVPWAYHGVALLSLLSRGGGGRNAIPVIDLLQETWHGPGLVLLATFLAFFLPTSVRPVAALLPLAAAAVSVRVTMPALDEVADGHPALSELVPEAWLIVASVGAAALLGTHFLARAFPRDEPNRAAFPPHTRAAP